MNSNDQNECVALFRRYLASTREKYTSLLEALCNIECGSEMIPGVNQAGDLITAGLEELGLSVVKHPTRSYGDNLTATTGLSGKQIVLGGHIDTTYIDYHDLPKFHLDGQYAVGPGTADMKGGVVVFLAAMGSLKQADLLKTVPLTLILNSDEERGAAESCELFKNLTATCRAALWSECAGPNGEVVVARRAKLSYQVDSYGVGRHAGDKVNTKVSALVELSQKIIAIEQLNERFEGSAFNVGRAWGGMASNTVPERATALVDVRFPTPQLEIPIIEAMKEICQLEHIPLARTELVQTSYRPPWEQTNSGASLFELTQRIAQGLGGSLTKEARGGTADSNWFGAAGIPCLDGFGPVGFDDHTPKERILLSSLFERALLVATLIMALTNDEG